MCLLADIHNHADEDFEERNFYKTLSFTQEWWCETKKNSLKE